MRKHKFKAWHKNEKKMCEVTVLTDQGAFLIGVQKGKDTHSDDGKQIVYAPDNGRFCLNDEIELIQFTGLKDKNGVEIYEKMILNNRYIVCFYKNFMYLCDISNECIIGGLNENESEITGEYYALSEDKKRNIDQCIRQAEREIKEEWTVMPIIYTGGIT